MRQDPEERLETFYEVASWLAHVQYVCTIPWIWTGLGSDSGGSLIHIYPTFSILYHRPIKSHFFLSFSRCPRPAPRHHLWRRWKKERTESRTGWVAVAGWFVGAIFLDKGTIRKGRQRRTIVCEEAVLGGCLSWS